MRRLLFFAVLMVAAFPAAASASPAKETALGATIAVSSDFTTVTYTVKNTSTQMVKAGRIVYFATSGGWPLKYSVPMKLKMNGLEAVPFNEIHKIRLPGFKPGQMVRFSVVYAKEDVRPKPTCHYLMFEGKAPLRKCNVKV